MELNTFKIHGYLILILLSAFICSCNDTEEEQPNLPKPEYVYDKPDWQWDESPESIREKLEYIFCIDDYRSNYTLTGVASSKNMITSYRFKCDKLFSVCLFIPYDSYSQSDIEKSFNGYGFVSGYDNPVYVSSAENTVGEISTVEYSGVKYYCIAWTKLNQEIAEAVDLGLSVKWANVNLTNRENYAALSPEDVGGYSGINLYGWGDPTGLKTIKDVTQYPRQANISGTTYDIARAKWGPEWRLPTADEYRELINACVWTWVDREVNEWSREKGYKITGPNGNSIYLTRTGGYREEERLKPDYSYHNDIGYYWTGTNRGVDWATPYVLIFGKDFKGLNYLPGGGLGNPENYCGAAIRPVREY